MKNEIMDKLLEIFGRIFEGEFVDENTTTSDFALWDSLRQIEIMISCEEEFGVHFSMKEIMNVTSVKALYQLIVEKRGGK